MTVSVIIPTFNEWKNIKRLIPRIIIELKKAKITSYEVIVVDDSDDETGLKLTKEYERDKKIQVVVRNKSNGLAGAILEGIKISRGDVIVGMDADFNHDPGILSEMINKARESDFVLASRFIEGGGMDEKGRYIFTKMFNFFLVNLLEFSTSDNMSGYYAMTRKMLNRLPLSRIYRGYGDYHLRLVWSVTLLQCKISEISVWYKKRKYGKSKSNLFKMFWNYSKEAIRLSGIKCIDDI